jgi:hypothetical protein
VGEKVMEDYLNKSQSQKILNCYSNVEDVIEKAGETTYEWRNVKGKTKTFRRRYKVSIGGEDKKKDTNPLGNRAGKYSAALSDELTHGVLVNGVFYNNRGERIHLSKEQLEEAKKEYSQKAIGIDSKGPNYKKEVNKSTQKRQEEISKQIDVKDPLYKEEVKKLKEKHDKLNGDEEVQKRRVDFLLKSIVTNKGTKHILQNLKSLQSSFAEGIDPTLTITVPVKGKDVRVERYLDDLVERFEKIDHDGVDKVDIKSIDINDFDEYTIDDFKKHKHKIDPATHKEIYKKINKKLGK